MPQMDLAYLMNPVRLENFIKLKRKDSSKQLKATNTALAIFVLDYISYCLTL